MLSLDGPGTARVTASEEYTAGHDIAIIGMSCRFPGADSYSQFWNNLLEGKNSIGSMASDRLEDCGIFDGYDRSKSRKPGGYLRQIDCFDPALFRLSPEEAMAMDPNQRIMLELAWEAAADAGVTLEQLKGTRTGVFIGRDHANQSPYAQCLAEDNLHAQAGNWSGVLASRISFHMDLHGPAVVTDTACSSALVSVHLACRQLQNGKTDMAFAGGISLDFYPGRSTGSIESFVENETGELRIFDRAADGTIWGEGAGVVLLKPLCSALADGDPVHAVIKGSAVNNDGKSNGVFAPNPDAQTEVLIDAWRDAGINPESISHLEAHGTGTKLGDPVEIKGLTAAFRQSTDKRQFCAIGSVKGNIGHIQAASGMASLIKTVMALKTKLLPPSNGFTVPNPFIRFPDSPVYLNDRSRAWEQEPRLAAVSCFGFSGTNCHMVFEEAGSQPEKGSLGKKLFVLSARSETGLALLAERYVTYLEDDSLSFHDLCYSAATARTHEKYRMAVLSDSCSDLREKLVRYHVGLTAGSKDDFYGYYPSGLGTSAGSGTELAPPLLETVLRNAALQFVKNQPVNWNNFLKTGRKLHLPVTPFEHLRFWPVPLQNKISRPVQGQKTFSGKGWFHQIVWEKAQQSGTRLSIQTYLIFYPRYYRDDALLSQLVEQGAQVTEVVLADEFSVLPGGIYSTAIDDESFARLREILAGQTFDRVLLCDPLAGTVRLYAEDAGRLVQQSVMLLYHLTRFLHITQPDKQTSLVLLSHYGNMVTGTESGVNPYYNMMQAVCRVIGLENDTITPWCIDLDYSVSSNDLVHRLSVTNGETVSVIRSGVEYVRRIREVNIPIGLEQEVLLRRGGCYVISGGTGGLGITVAKQLASRQTLRLALVSRSGFPSPDRWDAILSDPAQQSLSRKIADIREIERLGSEVKFYCADTADRASLTAALECITSDFGSIHGAIHAAGVAGEGAFIRKTEPKMQAVLAPKITGTLLMDELTAQYGAEFLILFSSAIGHFGAQGAGDYAGASAFQQDYARYRKRQGRNILCLSWPAWKETGMAAQYGADQDGSWYFDAIAPSDAMVQFSHALACPLPEVIIGTYNAGYAGQSMLMEKNTTSETGTVQTEYVPPSGSLEKALQEVWQTCFEKEYGINHIGVNDNYFELGGNSVLIVMLEIELEKRGIPLTGKDFYQYVTIRRQAEYLEHRWDKEKGSET